MSTRRSRQAKDPTHQPTVHPLTHGAREVVLAARAWPPPPSSRSPPCSRCPARRSPSQRLIASDGVASAQAGNSVAVDGGTIVVGHRRAAGVGRPRFTRAPHRTRSRLPPPTAPPATASAGRWRRRRHVVVGAPLARRRGRVRGAAYVFSGAGRRRASALASRRARRASASPSRSTRRVVVGAPFGHGLRPPRGPRTSSPARRGCARAAALAVVALSPSPRRWLVGGSSCRAFLSLGGRSAFVFSRPSRLFPAPFSASVARWRLFVASSIFGVSSSSVPARPWRSPVRPGAAYVFSGAVAAGRAGCCSLLSHLGVGSAPLRPRASSSPSPLARRPPARSSRSRSRSPSARVAARRRVAFRVCFLSPLRASSSCAPRVVVAARAAPRRVLRRPRRASSRPFACRARAGLPRLLLALSFPSLPAVSRFSPRLFSLPSPSLFPRPARSALAALALFSLVLLSPRAGVRLALSPRLAPRPLSPAPLSRFSSLSRSSSLFLLPPLFPFFSSPLSSLFSLLLFSLFFSLFSGSLSLSSPSLSLSLFLLARPPPPSPHAPRARPPAARSRAPAPSPPRRRAWTPSRSASSAVTSRPPSTVWWRRPSAASASASCSSDCGCSEQSTTATGRIDSLRRRSDPAACRRRGRRSASRARRAAAAADEAERVALAGRAGEQRERAGAALPPARHAQQPALEQMRREVLVADAELAALPAGADLDEHGQDDVADPRQPPVLEGAVEQRVEAADVELLGGGDEGVDEVVGPRRRGELARRLGKGEHGGLGRSDAAGHVRLHRAHALLVGRRVEAKAAGRALGLEEVVAALPGAQRRLLDADSRRELLDPPTVSGLGHADSIAASTNL